MTGTLIYGGTMLVLILAMVPFVYRDKVHLYTRVYSPKAASSTATTETPKEEA